MKNFKRKVSVILLLLIAIILVGTNEVYGMTSSYGITSFVTQGFYGNGTPSGNPYDDINSTTTSVSAYYSYGSTYRTNVNVGYNIAVPAGIKVISAKLRVYGYTDGSYYDYGDRMAGARFFGRLITSNLTLGWHEFDVTSYLSNFDGGSKSDTISTNFQEYHYNDNFVDNDFRIYMNGSTYKPQLIINYEYKPSTPIINSPLADSNNRGTVSLAATSTVTSGTITYNWQYSLDGSTGWTNIGSSTSGYEWEIPEEIEEDAKIYVRCNAVANGVSSVYSSAISFNNSYDPAVAAKIAAEKAKESVDKMIEFIGNPTVKIAAISKATATKDTSITTALSYTNKIGTLEDMEYSYRINYGMWGEWNSLNDTGEMMIDIPLQVGLNVIEVKVKNELGHISEPAVLNMWKL